MMKTGLSSPSPYPETPVSSQSSTRRVTASTENTATNLTVANHDDEISINNNIENECPDNDEDDDDDDDEEEEARPDASTVTSPSNEASLAQSDCAEAEQYRDFYLHSTAEIKQTLKTPPPKRKGPRGGVASAFPVKLHEMLSRCQIEGHDHIVSWQVHGRAFAVHQPSIFVEELMPRYFKQSKMTSFQRQLNLYGFMRKTDGTDRGSYYHELFLRGRPDLAKIMVRTRVKGECNKRRILAEPDFYKMPYCPEDPAIVAEEERLGRKFKPHPPHLDSSGSFLVSPAPSSGHHHHDLNHYSPYRNSGSIREDVAARPSQMQAYAASSPYYHRSRSYETARAEKEEEDDEEVGDSNETAQVTPSSDSHRRNSWYYHRSSSRHPNSSIFWDGNDEHVIRAPDDSDWTPPPFPCYRNNNDSPEQRERPKVKMIQPLYYSNMVTPNPANRRLQLYYSSSPSLQHRGQNYQRSPPPPIPAPPPYQHGRAASREDYDHDRRYQHINSQSREDADHRHTYYYPHHHNRSTSNHSRRRGLHYPNSRSWVNEHDRDEHSPRVLVDGHKEHGHHPEEPHRIVAHRHSESGHHPEEPLPRIIHRHSDADHLPKDPSPRVVVHLQSEQDRHPKEQSPRLVVHRHSEHDHHPKELSTRMVESPPRHPDDGRRQIRRRENPFGGQNFQPIDDSSLQMFESSIHH